MRSLALASCAAALAIEAAGQAPEAPSPSATAMQHFSSLIGIRDNLTVTPKAVSGRDGESTVGVEYRYERPIHRFLAGTEFDLYLESSGTFVADPALTPEARLKHSLRVNVIDLFNSQREDFIRYRDDALASNWRDSTAPLPTELQRLQDLYTEWKSTEDENEKGEYRKLMNAIWVRRSGHELSEGMQELQYLIEKAGGLRPFMSLDIELGAETNQEFTESQWVGGAQLRGKMPALGVPLEFLFGAVRGYERPVDYRNFECGPYVWGGIDFVDASESDARAALTTEERFTRVKVGAFHRGEVFSLPIDGKQAAVALELEWQFYSELDPPAEIKAVEQDRTSWFRATLLFPNNAILEYTDGRQPLDLTSGSTWFVGWRFSL